MNEKSQPFGDDSDLALMFDEESTPCGKLVAIVVPSWQVLLGDGEVLAYAMKAVDDEHDAYEWFINVSRLRPWETRH